MKNLSTFIYFTIAFIQIEARVWNPESYEGTSKWAKATAYEVIESMFWHGDEAVLDVGTGDGKIATWIASKVPSGRVLGIDNSPEMVAFANQRHKSDQISNLTFASGDALDFQTEEKFDLIISFTAMHLIPNQRRAVNHLASLLKVDGALLLKFPKNDGFEGALDKIIQLPKWRDYFFNFSAGWFFHSIDEYKTFILEAGLKVDTIEEGVVKERYDSAVELLETVRQWLPHHHILPQELQTPFLEELIALYLEAVPPMHKGKVSHYENFIIVKASKT